MLRDVYTAHMDKSHPAFAGHIAEIGKTIQKSQMAENWCFRAYWVENPTFREFLPFWGIKIVRRKLYEARSLFGTYIYTGKEFLRDRWLGWMAKSSLVWFTIR